MLKFTAADNSEDSPLLSKPVSLYVQCNKEGSEASLLTDELVMINTSERDKKAEWYNNLFSV